MTRRLSLRRRRAAAAPGAEPTPLSAPDGASVALPLPPEQTAVHNPVPAPDPAVPAGLEATPPDVPRAPGFRDRGRLRRRLRYLRRVRELGFRDLGGLIFDLHRFHQEGQSLVAGKLGALEAVDAELRTLEDALGDRREHTVLREPGIAACPRCAALHGSDANFCPNCGLSFRGPQTVAQVAPPPGALPARDEGAAPSPASVPESGTPPPSGPRADAGVGAAGGSTTAGDAPATSPGADPGAAPLRWASTGATPVSAAGSPDAPTTARPSVDAPAPPPGGPGARPDPPAPAP